MRVLVVDDDPGVRRMIRLTLEIEGIEVHDADNGTDALRSARELLPDVIVLDVMMPAPDGIEVARQLRDESRFDDTAIVFCSALVEESDQWRGWSVGADSYVTKPFTSTELESELWRVHRQRIGAPEMAFEAPELTMKGA